jgi:hypothetical protein
MEMILLSPFATQAKGTAFSSLVSRGSQSDSKNVLQYPVNLNGPICGVSSLTRQGSEARVQEGRCIFIEGFTVMGWNNNDNNFEHDVVSDNNVLRGPDFGATLVYTVQLINRASACSS